MTVITGNRQLADIVDEGQAKGEIATAGQPRKGIAPAAGNTPQPLPVPSQRLAECRQIRDAFTGRTHQQEMHPTATFYEVRHDGPLRVPVAMTFRWSATHRRGDVRGSTASKRPRPAVAGVRCRPGLFARSGYGAGPKPSALPQQAREAEREFSSALASLAGGRVTNQGGPHDARGRARRELTMARPLRKGRDRCSATRRDGEPCEAPAVPEMLVCRRHGGSAPQVQIESQHRQLQLRSFTATKEWLEARGTKGEDAALTRHGEALSELRWYEERLAYLRQLRAEVRRRKAEGATDPMEASPFSRAREPR